MANQYKNKVVYNGTTLMDITDTTAVQSDVASGKYFYTANGQKVEGTAISGDNAISVVDTLDSHGGTIRTITSVNISDTTATASDVASGKYFYTANGIKTEGTATGGGGTTPTLITKEITSNGTYTASNDSADGYSSVTVNVPSSGITPTGSLNIATNGTYDVTNYASAVVSVSGGGSSATQHVIHFDFTDETSTNINVYYDDALLATMIRAYTPETYGSKTVQEAQLDGVAWYTKSSGTWEVIFENSVQYNQDPDSNYPYCWIGDLADVEIQVGSQWRITFNGSEYICTAKRVDSYNLIGNPLYLDVEDDGTNVPLSLYNTGYGAWSGGANVPNVSANYPIKIERLVES